MKEKLLECVVAKDTTNKRRNRKNISAESTLPTGIAVWASPSLIVCGWGGTPGLCEPGLRWWFRAVLSQQLWAQRPIQPPYCFNWASKPGNDMSLQPALVSYMLCLHTKPFPLSALLVLEARHTGRLAWGWGCCSSLTISSRIARFSMCFSFFLQFVTNRAAMTDTKSCSREFHHEEERALLPALPILWSITGNRTCKHR